MDLFGAEAKYDDEDDGSEEFFDTPAVDLETPPLSPRTALHVQGHTDQEARLLRLYNEKRLPHALIFAGVEGIGKSTLAFRFARFLLAQGGEGDSLFGEPPPTENLDISADHPAFRKIAGGAHPDFLSIERAVDDAKGKKASSLDVAEIRKIVPFLRMRSTDGGWRVVLVDDADMMNRSSQNAILKILEEPPEKTLIILIAHRIGALIPTIRSRAQTLLLRPLSQAHFEDVLRAHGQGHLSATEMASLYTLSAASPGKALMLLEEGGLDNLARIIETFQSWPDFRWSDIHALAEEFGRYGNDNGFDSFARNMRWVAETLLRTKARGMAPEGPLSMRVFQEILERYSLEKLSETQSNLNEHLNAVEFGNLEKREAVLRSFAFWVK